MANTKISALPASTTPLAGTEVLPIVQGTATKQVSVANLTAGRAVSASSLALTGSPLPATSGGTDQSSYAVGDILYASTTTALSKLADVATGNALISGGVGVAPSWGKIGLTTHVSGVLPVANGGTNASSASITAFNNITGYTATGATGTTSTNLVFSTSPTLTTPTIAQINSNSSTAPSTFCNSSGTEYGKLARAWVNFAGGTSQGTTSITSSFNVSSITFSSTGVYQVNFTNNMPDANFVTVGSTQLSNGEVLYNGLQATSYTQVKVYAIGLGYYSNSAIHVAVFA